MLFTFYQHTTIKDDICQFSASNLLCFPPSQSDRPDALLWSQVLPPLDTTERQHTPLRTKFSYKLPTYHSFRNKEIESMRYPSD